MKLFGRLERFVMSEVAGPAALGLLVYTFLLMMRPLFNLVEMVLVRGVGGGDAWQVLGNTIPHILVLTIPMSFLFGVLIAVGRMNSDNEIVAMQAAGIPSTRLLRPVILMGLILAILNGWLYLLVIPDANRSLREMRVALFANAKNIGRIEPGVFYEEFPNLLLYVREVADRGGRWRGVLIFDSTDPVEQRLTLARHGGIVTTGDGNSPTSGDGSEGRIDRWILLEDVVNHQFNRSEPEAYRFSHSYQQVVRPDGGSKQKGVVRYQLDMRERRTASIVSYLTTGSFDDPGDEQDDMGAKDSEEKALERRLAMVELHRRVAIPSACLVFAFLAVPLGVGSRSGGRGRGFIVSIAVILAYYIMSNNGELLAVEGRIPPWLGVWFANLSLVAFAVFLITRMGRWLGERQRPEGFIARWLRRRKATRRARAEAGRSLILANGVSDGLAVRRRILSGFPTILDRYVIQRLIAPFALVIVSTSLLYVVIDLTDHVDEMAENKVPFGVIASYYFNLVPQLIMDIMPLALMIAVLILLTVLERQQELTAFKAGGISLYRVVIPILLVASAAAWAMWFLSESIIPESNRKAKILLDRIKGRDTAPRLYTSGGRQWLLSRDDRSFYSFLQFDESNGSMVRFTKLTIDEGMELRFHLFAARVTYENGSWMAHSGWFRRVEPDGTVDFEMITGPTEVGIPETPEYFAHERRLPSEMSVRELKEHIDELVDSGHYPARLIVRWHQKFANPLAVFLMVFLALPFGLNRGGRRVTTMQGVAMALVLGIIYYVSVAFFGKLGEAEVLPAVIGAWSPAILVCLLAVNRMTTLRT